MEKKKKDQYLVAVSGVVLSIILVLITLNTGTGNIGGKITALFAFIFGCAGILSFFSENVAEIFIEWINNIATNHEREIHQQQHKPQSSPQTGVIHGDQHIHYGTEQKSVEKENPSSRNKVKRRLIEIRSRLTGLKKVSHKEGNREFSPLKKEVKGIIHRIYSNNPQVAEKRLIHNVLWMISKDTQESDYQDWYIEDVEGLMATIDIIIREMDLD